MKTKYVLNSGGMSNNEDGARRFFAELFNGLGNKPKMLLCFFAQPREVWEQKIESYKESFDRLSPENVKPIYEMALPDKFKQQVANADVIYCHGGDDNLAMYWFSKLNVTESWKGKVVGTNSATTHALSKYFWTCDWRGLKDGLGVLPIKTIAHYNSDYGVDDSRGPIDWEAAKKALESYGDKSLPLYALPEGEFIKFEVEDA